MSKFIKNMSGERNIHLKIKPDLPKGWIAKESTKYPGRIYYFNVETGCSTWELPTAENDKLSCMQNRNCGSYKAKQNSSESNVCKMQQSKDKESMLKKKEMNNKKERDQIPVNRNINRLQSKQLGTTKEENASSSRSDLLYQIVDKRKRASSSSSYSSKKLKLFHTKETIQDSNDSSTNTVPEKEKNPFELALLSTCKGSNNIPLLSAKEKKKQLREEIELRQALKARQHLSEVSHRKTKSAPVCTKDQGSDSISVRGLAEKRLKELRKKLVEEQAKKLEEEAKRLKDEEVKKLKEEHAKKLQKEEAKKLEEKQAKKLKEEQAKIYEERGKEHHLKEFGSKGIAEKRLKALQKNLAVERENKELLLSDLIQKEDSGVKSATGCKVLDLSENDSSDEAMEWEPIEEEKILSHIQEVRNEIQQVSGTNLGDTSIPAGKICADSILNLAKKEKWFIVLDTNILISHLLYVQELINTSIKDLGMPVLVIPWQVFQELDVIKDRKGNSSLAYLARKAVNFIHTKLKMKHPRLIGQTALDAIPKDYNKDDIPDDSILQCCIQMAQKGNLVILLSNDKNLCNKAMVNGIKAYQKSEIKDALEELSLENLSQNEGSVIAQNERIIELQKNSKSDDRPSATYEIIYKLKTVLKDLLEKVLENEMHKIYDENWIKIMIFKPPWTLLQIFQCFLKHWIAVFTSILPKKSKFLFEALKEFFSKTEEGYDCTLVEIEKIIEISLSLCTTVQSKEYDVLVSKSVSDLKNLKSLCKDKNAEISKENKPAEPSSVGQSQGVKVIYNILEEFYSLVIIFCGVMCDLLEIQHCLVYSRPEPFPSLNEVREKLPDLYPRVNSLVRNISGIREVSPDLLNLEHEAIRQLFFTFKNCLPNLDEITPELILNFCTSGNTRNSLAVVQTKFEEAEVLLNRGISYFMQDSV